MSPNKQKLEPLPVIPERVTVRLEHFGGLNAQVAANFARWRKMKPGRSWGREGSLSRFIQDACREFYKEGGKP